MILAMNNVQNVSFKIPMTLNNKSIKTYKLVKVISVKLNTVENKTTSSYDEAKSNKTNKTAHMTNGNINTVLLQVNSSNSDWVTKQTELLSTITDNKANITIVSEANVEHNDDKKTVSRNSAFKEYNIEYKVVKNNQKARIAVVLEKEIKYSRLDN